MPDTQSSFSKISDVLVRYCTIALAFLAPFFVIPAVWANAPQSKALIAAVLLIVALIVWLIGIVSSRRITFSIDPILIAGLLIPITYVSSAFFSNSALTSFVSG